MLRLRCLWPRSAAPSAGAATSCCPHLGNQKQFSVSINRCGGRPWTEHEKKRLVIENNSGRTLHDIATILQRSVPSVRAERAKQAQAGLLEVGTSAKPFTPEEDARILSARSQGLGWTAMREQFPGRSQVTLRNRFALKKSSPATSETKPRTRYTPEEDQMIMEAIQHNETSWKDLAQRLPNRSLGSLRSRYYILLPARQRVHRLPANRFIWDEKQTDQLRHLSAQGLSILEISRKFAKSYHSIRGKLRKLNFSPPGWTNRSQPVEWTTDELSRLRALYEEGLSRGDIAMKLNRPFAAVEAKLHTLPDISIRGRLKQDRGSRSDTRP